VDVAREMMSSDDIYDRILAAGALSDIGDAQALVLLERCIGIDDIVIRRSAIDTLISGSHPNSVNLLFKAASEDDEVLGLMAESLSSVPRDDMGTSCWRRSTARVTSSKKHALQALVRSTGSAESAAVRKLVAQARRRGRPRVRQLCLAERRRQLGRRGNARHGRCSSNADELEVAAVALGLIDSKESRAALDKLTKANDQRVVLAAIASKAALGDQDAVAQIIKTIGYGRPMEATVMAGSLKRLPRNWRRRSPKPC